MNIYIATPSLTDAGFAFTILRKGEEKDCDCVKSANGFNFYVEKESVEEFFSFKRLPSYYLDPALNKLEDAMIYALTGALD
jgi:hypothetical protein